MELCTLYTDTVSTTSCPKDRHCIEGVKTWFSEAQKDVYGVGPLLPRSYWDTVQSDGGAANIRNFLDKMHEEYGGKSVVFVRIKCYSSGCMVLM